VKQWFETAGQGKDFDQEVRLLTRDGLVKWIHSRSVPLRNPDGTVRGHVGTVEDITERKKTETELIRAARDRAAGGQLKSEFVANMSPRDPHADDEHHRHERADDGNRSQPGAEPVS